VKKPHKSTCLLRMIRPSRTLVWSVWTGGRPAYRRHHKTVSSCACPVEVSHGSACTSRVREPPLHLDIHVSTKRWRRHATARVRLRCNRSLSRPPKESGRGHCRFRLSEKHQSTNGIDGVCRGTQNGFVITAHLGMASLSVFRLNLSSSNLKLRQVDGR
jgi:hypothetical protein